MNRLPDSFFGDAKPRQAFDTTASNNYDVLWLQKIGFPATPFFISLDVAIEEAFSRRVEEVDGKTATLEEAHKFGYLQRTTEKPDELLVIWRGRPLLHIEWNSFRKTFKIQDV
jgi:hypothetical protein